MLDSLTDTRPMSRLSAQTWLLDSANSLERILDPVLVEILHDPATLDPDVSTAIIDHKHC